MAQTKAKSKTTTRKRTSSAQPNGGRARTSRPKSSARKSTSAKKSTAKGKATSAKTRRSSQSRSGESRARNSAGFVDKAKKPALATGAVLLGLAGGATAVARGAKRRGPKLPRPKLNLSRPSVPKGMTLPKSGGSTAAWVGEKAKALGDAGHRVADMSSEAAKVEKSLRKG